MLRKRKTTKIEDSGVDKFESLIQNYYKHILIAIASIILLIVIIYVIINVSANTRSTDADIVSKSELELTSVDALPSFIELAKEVPDFADYIYMTAGIAYLSNSEIENTINTLKLAGGEYKELSSYILSDLGEKVDISEYIVNGKLSALWYYEAILDSDNDSKTAILIKDFIVRHPESKLIDLLSSWGYNTLGLGSSFYFVKGKEITELVKDTDKK